MRLRVLEAAPPADVVSERLASIRARIEHAGADPDAVTVIAVTKGFDSGAAAAALAVGLDQVGENYADELLHKAADPATAGAAWNFIGGIQRRIVKKLAPFVVCWQTLSRPEEISSVASASPGAEIFVQVDTTGLAQRNGCRPSDVARLVEMARDSGLTLRGLMTVGPPGGPAGSRPAFELVASLGKDLGLRELSMGMTGDLEEAIRAGSTMLRVGRGLFGERKR